MITLIILINNFDKLNNFNNNIFLKIPKLNCILIAHNTNEFIHLIQKYKPNLILISKYYYSKISKLNLLNFKYFKSIILTSNTLFNNPCNAIFLFCSINDANLLNSFEEFLNKKFEIELKNKVLEILNNFNFNFKFIGTNYLIDAIIYSYINKDSYIFENLEKNIYPIISYKNNANSKNIKCSIVRAILVVTPAMSLIFSFAIEHNINKQYFYNANYNRTHSFKQS